MIDTNFYFSPTNGSCQNSICRVVFLLNFYFSPTKGSCQNCVCRVVFLLKFYFSPTKRSCQNFVCRLVFLLSFYFSPTKGSCQNSVCHLVFLLYHIPGSRIAYDIIYGKYRNKKQSQSIKVFFFYFAKCADFSTKLETITTD